MKMQFDFESPEIEPVAATAAALGGWVVVVAFGAVVVVVVAFGTVVVVAFGTVVEVVVLITVLPVAPAAVAVDFVVVVEPDDELEPELPDEDEDEEFDVPLEPAPLVVSVDFATAVCALCTATNLMCNFFTFFTAT